MLRRQPGPTTHLVRLDPGDGGDEYLVPPPGIVVRRIAPAGADRFADLGWEPGRSGVPLLTDALAALECETVTEHPTGDHSIVIGRVEGLRVSAIDDPLLFFAGTFRVLR